MKQKAHGGSRDGAGRKPVGDPKKQLSIYIPESAINAVGGDQVAKDIATAAVLKQSRKNIC